MNRRPLILVFITTMLLLGSMGVAQDDPAAAARTDVDAALRTEQRGQQAREAWDTERTALEQRFRQARVDADWLAGWVERERTAVTALVAKRAELERRLIESVRLTESLEDTLAVLVDRLDTSVAADLPFLDGERSRRLASLRLVQGDPDASSAEKLRRVLEAYQVEAGYGGTVEMMSEPIDVDGRQVHADVLRLGRLALLWRTPDGSRAGVFDPGAGAWTELPRGDHHAIGRAMEMADRMRPVAVIGLPLGRIER